MRRYVVNVTFSLESRFPLDTLLSACTNGGTIVWNDIDLWGKCAKNNANLTCMLSHKASENRFCAFFAFNDPNIRCGSEWLSAKKFHVTGREP